MLRRERLAVDRVCEQDLVAHRVLQRQAPLVRVLDVALDPAVEAGENDLARRRGHACLLEDRRERRARPLGGADRLAQPRLAERARREQRTAVAGALERHGQRPCRPGLQFVQRERQRPLDQPADVEAPGRGIDRGDVEVDQQVVQPGRRDRVPQRLKRQRVIPRGELQLLERDVGADRALHLWRHRPTFRTPGVRLRR